LFEWGDGDDQFILIVLHEENNIILNYKRLRADVHTFFAYPLLIVL